MKINEVVELDEIDWKGMGSSLAQWGKFKLAQGGYLPRGMALKVGAEQSRRDNEIIVKKQLEGKKKEFFSNIDRMIKSRATNPALSNVKPSDLIKHYVESTLSGYTIPPGVDLDTLYTEFERQATPPGNIKPVLENIWNAIVEIITINVQSRGMQGGAGVVSAPAPTGTSPVTFASSKPEIKFAYIYDPGSKIWTQHYKIRGRGGVPAAGTATGVTYQQTVDKEWQQLNDLYAAEKSVL